MSLYLWVMIFTLLGPLALSFDKKIHFYTHFKRLFISIILVAIPFLLWDEYFTQNQVWGFNPDYLEGIFFGHLPLEEILFFILVPYACIFIYEVLKGYFPNLNTQKLTKVFVPLFATLSFVLAIMFYENGYTFSACLLASVLTLLFGRVLKKEWLGNFLVTYLVALIPFVIVNGILTGMATPEPIVWYSEAHIMGIRIITIPLEDLFYNFDLLILIVAIYESLRKKT
jgi:lycopene cyclase domain-containing protein